MALQQASLCAWAWGIKQHSPKKIWVFKNGRMCFFLCLLCIKHSTISDYSMSTNQRTLFLETLCYFLAET